MTERIVKVVRRVASKRPLEVEVCFEGGTEPQMGRWLGQDFIFSDQVPGDLGERMGAAFHRAFRNGAHRVVLIGTDIPGASERHIGQAFDALEHRELVIGPSHDGGYWLLGMKRPEDLFHGIAWGTERVLQQTTTEAQEKGLATHMLETLSDLDRAEQVGHLMPGWSKKRPYLSVIIPTLNEEKNVQQAIRGARRDWVECVVVDGGSTDRTASLAQRSGARVCSSPPGRALQQNRGAEIAQGKVFLFLHADTALPEDYMSQVFETLMGRSIVMGAFGFRTDMEHPMMKGIETLANFRSRVLGLPYGDQGLFIRGSVFRRVRGYPEVPLAEDLFFVRKMARLGRIGIAPGHVVTSARKWRRMGLMQTTLFNQIIAACCLLGVSPERLLPLYRKHLAKKGK
jgi:rSAM/selenodomain-associated transferase 2/rSAM/selenodomain-associated transferase 1